jgi:hypothetical protein
MVIYTVGKDWKIIGYMSADQKKKRLHYAGYGDEENCFGVLMHEKKDRTSLKMRYKPDLCTSKLSSPNRKSPNTPYNFHNFLFQISPTGNGQTNAK